MAELVRMGDYVLATKYSDGDPHDQWAVGFYDQQCGDRHYVRDAAGQQFRANGFRRVKKITRARGEWLLRNTPGIEFGTRSLWWWVRAKMEKDADNATTPQPATDAAKCPECRGLKWVLDEPVAHPWRPCPNPIHQRKEDESDG